MRSNPVEWAALVVSIVTIVAVAGFLVVDALTDAGRPPSPVVRLERDQAYSADTGWVVPAVVTNAGDRAAERLVLQATARVDGQAQPSQVEVDFLPAGTEVRVYFAFAAPPEGEIDVRVVGFRAP